MPITATTKLVGIIGWPITYTLSPPMHNAAFTDLGIDYAYVPLRVDPAHVENIKRAVLALASLGFVGANVTIPYKQAVIPFLHSISPRSRQASSVNTIIVNKDGTLFGDSTDGEGICSDLIQHGIDVTPLSVAILGAGGAARAIAFSLLAAGCSRLTIVNRNQQNADELATSLRDVFPQKDIDALTIHAGTKALATAELVVNCTPPSAIVDITFSSHQIIYDTNYMKSAITIKQSALKARARFIDGLGMLLYAGAASFALFTGLPAPLDRMKHALHAAAEN